MPGPMAMAGPVFEEFEPARDCACGGCVRQRRARTHRLPLREGGHPAARGARRVLVLATAAGVVLWGGGVAAAVPPAGHAPVRADDPDPDPDAAPAPDPDPAPDAGQGTPQGGKGPLHGPAGKPAVGKPGAPPAPKVIDRATIINRAKRWVREKVPYSMTLYWKDGYRQDCSGYVSMVWNLGSNEWTGSLDRFATKITKDQLRPGDMLLFHNPENPTHGSHVTIFGGWADEAHTSYIAYEQKRPHTRRLATPYAYWDNADRYVPYRYDGVTPEAGAPEAPEAEQTPDRPGAPEAPGDLDGPETPGAPDGPGLPDGQDAGKTPDRPGAPGEPDGPQVPEAGEDPEVLELPDAPSSGGGASGGSRYPGAGAFGPGAHNAHISRLGEMLLGRGAARFYGQGPGPRWDEADRRATRAFQRAQGWKGAAADGLPDGRTWRLLAQEKGKDIPRPARARASAVPAPAYPGKGIFRPGKSGPAIERLGGQLVKKGFGKHYASGPGPRWGEADRRNVEAFQRAQGWRGAAADGYPGPETWRRLFA